MIIKLRRLKDVKIKGNFTINCDTNDEFIKLQIFFCASGDYIKFKNISKSKTYLDQLAQNYINIPFFPLYICGDTRTKFIIKYESLEELLKLREIFRVRSGKFDMYLIKKRGYDMFTNDFYKACENTDILKVRK